ncbi:MAG: Stp1/IreP family PP2C-type Ser/Thr phosphatase [Deltaproteobacteria bacterium]|nr:Stp1/IreP family PP2C-type Ser/Thr phosphatase [Deltaproteobacteria bacterium]
MQIKAAGLTHVGMKRTHNEDSFFTMEEENLFIVADGMGGHSSGEVASQMAVETVANFFKATSNDDEVTWPFKMDKERDYQENRLVTGMKLANLRIYEAAQREAKYRGMGTTMVSSLFSDGVLIVGHVGDSRGYRVRGGQLEQLTEDHSLLNDYIKAKKLTPEEIENFPHKNVIVRALGMKETVQVDILKLKPMENDIYLMCTDGLSGMVNDQEIVQVVNKSAGLDQAAAELIARANQNGGMDNITTILLKFIA